MSAHNDEGGGPRERQPNARQVQILEAFARKPIAAAVARELHTNERHVRRIVEAYPSHLGRFRRARREEERQHRQARDAELVEWANGALPKALDRLEGLAASEKEPVALKALKLQLDLILRIRQEDHLDLAPEIEDAIVVLHNLVDETRDGGVA